MSSYYKRKYQPQVLYHNKELEYTETFTESDMRNHDYILLEQLMDRFLPTGGWEGENIVNIENLLNGFFSRKDIKLVKATFKKSGYNNEYTFYVNYKK